MGENVAVSSPPSLVLPSGAASGRRGAGGGTLEGGDHHGEGATGLALGGWEVTPGEAPK